MRHTLAFKSKSPAERAFKSTFCPRLRQLRQVRRFFQISPTYARTHTHVEAIRNTCRTCRKPAEAWCDHAAVVRVGRMTGQAGDRLQGGSAGGGGSFPGGPPRGVGDSRFSTRCRKYQIRNPRDDA